MYYDEITMKYLKYTKTESTNILPFDNINRVFIGAGYSLSPNFSFGADVQYNFGTVENEAKEFVSDAIFQDDVQLGTRERNTSNITGLSANIGFLYQKSFNEKMNFYSSLTYSPESKLKSINLLFELYKRITPAMSAGVIGYSLFDCGFVLSQFSGLC